MSEYARTHLALLSLLTLRQLAILYLLLQAAGASAWWLVLLFLPGSRFYFLATASPDVNLLAFGLADFLLYIMLSLICAYGFWRDSHWYWPLLCIHTGAAMYAGLYCWTLTWLTGGDAIIGAILMTPSLVVPGYLTYRTMPREQPC